MTSQERFDFDSGLQLYRRGRYEEAYTRFRQCDDIPESKFYIGLSFEKGNGVAQDINEALNWYVEAAEYGHPGSMFRLGQIYEKGTGVDKNLRMARHWYGMGAKAGNQGCIGRLEELSEISDSKSSQDTDPNEYPKFNEKPDTNEKDKATEPKDKAQSSGNTQSADLDTSISSSDTLISAESKNPTTRQKGKVPVNESEGKNNEKTNKDDDDMKYKAKFNILLVVCGLLCIASIGSIVYYSNKLKSEKDDFDYHLGNLARSIDSRMDSINKMHELIADIYNICNNYNNKENIVTFPNWTSSNHDHNTTDTKEYTFTGVEGDELSFSYRVDSESCDKLYCYLYSAHDTIKLLQVGGVSLSGEKKLLIPRNGSYTLSFRYKKDQSVHTGKDLAEITRIRCTKPIQSEILEKIYNFEKQPYGTISENSVSD